MQPVVRGLGIWRPCGNIRAVRVAGFGEICPVGSHCLGESEVVFGCAEKGAVAVKDESQFGRVESPERLFRRSRRAREKIEPCRLLIAGISPSEVAHMDTEYIVAKHIGRAFVPCLFRTDFVEFEHTRAITGTIDVRYALETLDMVFRKFALMEDCWFAAFRIVKQSAFIGIVAGKDRDRGK